MADVLVRRLMPWSVNFEDEACVCCVTEMMAATAVDQAGGALSLLTPSKMQTHLKPRDTVRRIYEANQKLTLALTRKYKATLHCTPIPS